ncbi:MAG: YIP1 family protein [Anaerolineaceae bacterium]|nr:YIP1 family protein [Anaerolineaceae bacterium]
MSSLLNTLLRTVILDDSAYREWRERPNVFLRGIVLILIVSLIAGLVGFGMRLVSEVQPVDADEIREGIRESFEMQRQFNPGFQDPEVYEMAEEMVDTIVAMIVDIANIRPPLPVGVAGFFTALGAWLTGALSSIGGWLFYGALVLVAVNLLGGSAKLRDFYGTVAVFSIPGLIGLLGPIPCVGGILVFLGTIWGIVMYVKATSVATGLDIGRSVVAVLAPFVILLLLALALTILFVLWMVIIF